MKHKSIATFIAAAAMAVSSFAATTATKPKITMEQARTIALKKAPGTIKSAELENEHGKLIYSFDIATSAKAITEVNVDALNGKIVAVQQENAAKEAAASRLRLRGYVEYEAANVAEKFAADVAEIVVFAVEVSTVSVNHPGEAHRLILDLVELLESAEQALLHALFFFLQVVLAVDAFAHVKAAEEVMILAWDRAKLRIGGQVL